MLRFCVVPLFFLAVIAASDDAAGANSNTLSTSEALRMPTDILADRVLPLKRAQIQWVLRPDGRSAQMELRRLTFISVPEDAGSAALCRAKRYVVEFEGSTSGNSNPLEAQMRQVSTNESIIYKPKKGITGIASSDPRVLACRDFDGRSFFSYQGIANVSTALSIVGSSIQNKQAPKSVCISEVTPSGICLPGMNVEFSADNLVSLREYEDDDKIGFRCIDAEFTPSAKISTIIGNLTICGLRVQRNGSIIKSRLLKVKAKGGVLDFH